MKHYFLINPAAGDGQITNDLITKIVSAANAEDINFRIYIKKHKGDAADYIKAKCEAHMHEGEPLRFYACGGDGTLNEVVNAAVHYPNAEVAVIPVGTGNDFVKNFSSKKFFMNMRRQIRGTATKIDLLKFNDRYCANILNIGFDCSVVIKMSEFRRNRFVPNKFAYGCGILSALKNEYGANLRIQLDDEEPMEKEFLLAAFGKGSYYGGGYKALPLTISDDGYIDTCLATKIARRDFIKYVGKYKKGEHLDLFFISYKKCRKVRLESDEPIGVCADGEVTMETCVEIEVAPRALAFSVPEGCEFSAISREDASAEQAKDYDYQEV